MTNVLISGVLIITTSHADRVLHEGSQPDKILRGPIITVDIHPTRQRKSPLWRVMFSIISDNAVFKMEIKT